MRSPSTDQLLNQTAELSAVSRTTVTEIANVVIWYAQQILRNYVFNSERLGDIICVGYG